jgi:hypothetical protein
MRVGGKAFQVEGTSNRQDRLFVHPIRKRSLMTNIFDLNLNLNLNLNLTSTWARNNKNHQQNQDDVSSA